MNKMKAFITGVKDVLNIIGNYFLNILALLLLLILYVPNMVTQIIIARKQKATLKVTSKMQFEDAYAIDVFGAKVYREFWNTTCVKKDGILFSPYIEQTISWYLAANRKNNKLTYFGIIVYYIILIADFTTWTKGGHFNFYKD